MSKSSHKVRKTVRNHQLLLSSLGVSLLAILATGLVVKQRQRS